MASDPSRNRRAGNPTRRPAAARTSSVTSRTPSGVKELSGPPPETAYVETAEDAKLLKKLALEEDQVKIMRMRNAGMTFQRIAERLEMDPRRAYVMYHTAIRRVADDAAATALEWQIGLTKDLIAALYPNAMRGNTDAVGKIVDVMEHQAKLLGIYAPAKVELGMTKQDFAETVAGLLESSVPQQDQGELLPAPDHEWQG